MKIVIAAYVIVCLCVLSVAVMPAFCWSNGGYSADPAHPDYGTHDWIAQHALDYLPAQEKQYITDNLAVYLLGTELPDNGNDSIGGIGDTTKHHIYYSAAGALVDDASAKRANETYNQALTYLRSKDYVNAARTAGIMTHYVADIAVFSHNMGKSTAWGEEQHHSDYENYVDTRTNSYSDTFNSYLSYDGSLSILAAYNATVVLAYDTTFGGSSQRGCVWMDTHYNWSDPAFSGRCGESLNLAVNAVADVLHKLYVESSPSPTVSPTPVPTVTSTPVPTASPTPTPAPTLTPMPSPTPSPTPTTAPSPTTTASPTPQPSATQTTTPQPTPSLTATPKPSASPNPTPTVPEYPAAILLLATVLALTAFAMLCKKKPKSGL